MKKEAVEAGYKIDPTMGPDRQIRQRRWQQFQRHPEHPTGDAATGASDPYISSMLRVLLSKVQAGIYRGHLPFIGGHLPDGKSGIRREWSALSNLIFFIFKDFACWKQQV